MGTAIEGQCPDENDRGVTPLTLQKAKAIDPVMAYIEVLLLFTFWNVLQTNTIDETIKLEKVQLADAVKIVFYSYLMTAVRNHKENNSIVPVYLENSVTLLDYMMTWFTERMLHIPILWIEWLCLTFVIPTRLVKDLHGSDHMHEKYLDHWISILSQEGLTHQ